MNSKRDFIVVVVMLSVIGMDDLLRRRGNYEWSNLGYHHIFVSELFLLVL